MSQAQDYFTLKLYTQIFKLQINICQFQIQNLKLIKLTKITCKYINSLTICISSGDRGQIRV